MPGDIFECHNWELVLLAWGGAASGATKLPRKAQDSPTMKNDPAQNVSRAEIQSWSRLGGVLNWLFFFFFSFTISLLKSIFRHFPL